MFIHCKTSTAEFIDHLRYTAISAGETPQYIDAVDRLAYLSGLEAELEKTGDELSVMEKNRDEMEKNRDDLLDELQGLCKVLDENLDPDPDLDQSIPIKNALKVALRAIKRHMR